MWILYLSRYESLIRLSISLLQLHSWCLYIIEIMIFIKKLKVQTFSKFYTQDFVFKGINGCVWRLLDILPLRCYREKGPEKQFRFRFYCLPGRYLYSSLPLLLILSFVCTDATVGHQFCTNIRVRFFFNS